MHSFNFYFCNNFWHTDAEVNLQQNFPPPVMAILALPCETKQKSVCS